MSGSRAFAFVVKEFEEVLPPILFFVGGFNLVEFTPQLVLDDYLARFANYLVATMAALVVGKAVLLADLLCHSSAALTRHLSSNRFCSRPSSTLHCCRVPGANPGEDRRILARWRHHGRYSGLRGAPLLLALARRGSDMDLRSVLSLHVGYRT